MIRPFAILLCLPLVAGCATMQELGFQPGSGNASGDKQLTSSASDSDREKALYLDLISSLQQRDLHRAALAHLDEFDRRFGATPASARRRAESLSAIGDYAAAEAAFRAQLASTTDGSAYAGLGTVQARQGEWPEAVDSFNAAIAREPTKISYLNNLGYALFRAGQPTQAEFRLRQAEEMDANNQEIRNNLIMVLMAAGRTKEAEDRLGIISDKRQRDDVRREAIKLARGDQG